MANTFEITFYPKDMVPLLAYQDTPGQGMRQYREFWTFSPAAAETLYSPQFVMPAAYAAGTVYCKLFFTMANTATGNVVFNCAVEAITPADAHNLITDEYFDTENDSASTAVPGTTGYLGTVTITLTNKDSVAAGDLVRLKITRDVADGGDDANSDARVYAVQIYEAA